MNFLTDHKKLCLHSYYFDKKPINEIREDIIKKAELVLNYIFNVPEFLEVEKLGYLNIISSSTFEKFTLDKDEITIFSDILFYLKEKIVAINFLLSDYQYDNVSIHIACLWLESLTLYKSFEKNISIIFPLSKKSIKP